MSYQLKTQHSRLRPKRSSKQRKLPLTLNSQRGVVIVIALFLVALVATMSYTMMARLARDTRRSELIMHDVQAGLYAEGSVLWAKDSLRQDWIKQKKDKRVDETPIKSPQNDQNGYKIKSEITDAQGKFNLNNLTKPEAQADLVRLIRLVYPKMSQEAANSVARATVDWVMPGARDNEYSRYYAELPIPYRAAHRMMVDPSEWNMVKGVTPELYNAMKPYITALPMVTQINPIAAEPPVLALLNSSMSLETASALKELLQKNPPQTLEAFKALDFIKNHPVKDDQIIWTSQFFMVETEVGIGRQHIMLYTLLQRMSSTGKADVIVLWQNRGST
jgi:general secretion pathway protein K